MPTLITDTVAVRVAPRWRDALDPEVLACPAESVCGRDIITICQNADALIAVTDPIAHDSILSVVITTTAVVWFG